MMGLCVVRVFEVFLIVYYKSYIIPQAYYATCFLPPDCLTHLSLAGFCPVFVLFLYDLVLICPVFFRSEMSCLSCFRAIKSPVFPTWQPEMCVGILRINLHNLATENRHNHFIQVHVQVNIFDQFYTLKDTKRLGQNFYFIFWVAFRQKCIKLFFFFRFILFLWLSSGKRDDAYFEDSTQNPCHTPNLSIILYVSVRGDFRPEYLLLNFSWK